MEKEKKRKNTKKRKAANQYFTENTVRLGQKNNQFKCERCLDSPFFIYSFILNNKSGKSQGQSFSFH